MDADVSRRPTSTARRCRPTRAALGLVLAVLPSTAWSAPITVPSQPLSSALVSFGGQANVQILFSPDLVQGLRAPPLNGEMSVEQGLSRLLGGSGLVYRIDGNTVTLARPAAPAFQAVASGSASSAAAGGDVVTLPAVTVSAERREDIAGPVSGYVATRTATGAKTDTPLVEVPQSISVITRDQLRDRNVQTDSEALLYTPGILAQPFGSSLNQYNNFFRIRGFPTSFGGSYVDGLINPVNYRDEPYGIERYEVLRGPNSVLYGQSDPGGLVNRTTKRPTAERFGEAIVEYGNYDYKQAGIDLGGPIDEAGEFLYRFTAMARDADLGVKYRDGREVDNDRIYIAPALTWNISPDTTLTVLGSYLKDDAGQASNYVTPDYKVTRTRLDAPGASDFDYDQQYIGYAFEHRLTDGLTFRQRLRYAHMDYDYVSLAQLDISNPSPVVERYAFGFKEERNDFLVDNNLEAQVTTGPVQHTFLAGIDYQRLRDRVAFLSDFGIDDLILDNPDYGRISPTLTTDADTLSKTWNTGVYLQDQMRIADRVVITLGGRMDWSRSTKKGYEYGPEESSRDQQNDFTYRAGITYLGDYGIAPYFSYAESFLPTVGVNASTGERLKPTTGEQFEVGVKYQPPGMNALFTLAAFDLTKQNVVTTEVIFQNGEQMNGIQRQTGEIRSRGIEFEATAHLTDELRLRAAYTYLDAEITKSDSGSRGDRPQLTPRHAASLWLDYDLRDGPMAGLGLGAGVRYIGATAAWERDTGASGENPGKPLRNSAYTLFDAAIRYDLGYAFPSLAGTTVALNATNLFDNDYQICYSRFDCQPGVPLTVIGSLTYRW